MIKTWIVWGSDGWIQSGDDDSTKPKMYSFNTQEEMNAFFLGIAEADGYNGYPSQQYCGFDSEEEAQNYIKEIRLNGDMV